MSKAMGDIDQRTQLAGKNRFEMLLFYLNGPRRYGINVFKVREVILVPRLTHMPGAHRSVRGIAQIRGQPIAIIDLCQATMVCPSPSEHAQSVIITEYNRMTQGFLVEGVDRIVNLNWEEVMPPPQSLADRAYLTAVTRVDGELVQILDVEKVLQEVIRPGTDFELKTPAVGLGIEANHLMVVDDSLVARNQIKQALEPDGWEITLAKNGAEALEMLKSWTDDPSSPLARTLLVISDIEMPRMDGYTLTTSIRADPRLAHLKIILHTSLSGVFNQGMVRKVGADEFLSKFNSGELVGRVREIADTALAQSQEP